MTFRVDKPTEMNRAQLTTYMQQLMSQLRWKHALDECIRDRREYTEIHFWRDPETDQFVLTYWEIN